MNDSLLRSLFTPTSSLLLIALLVALLLGAVFELSAPHIARQQEAALRANLMEIFPADETDPMLYFEPSITLSPENSNFVNIELLALRENKVAYRITADGSAIGIILPAVAREAYNGDIDLLVGIAADGAISGVRVLQHRETPGLGDKIELRISDWILGFDGHSLNNTAPPDWTVQKAGGEFDQFSGATITPRALIQKVRDVLMFYQQNKDELLNL
jgi:electron transport complex protein RnfG